MDILFNMHAFASVAETGSFTAAAQRLNLAAAYVSRMATKLEAHLQTRLLHCITQRIVLIEAGQRYLMHAQQMFAYIGEAEVEAGDVHTRLSGTLKVHTMIGIGQHHLTKAILQYCETYPEIDFDLISANRITDIPDKGYGIPVVIAPELPDSGFVFKCIGQAYSIPCASPGYIAAYGFSKLLVELFVYRCLHLANSVMSLDRWLFDGPDGQELVCINQTHFQINTADAITEAVASSMGIGALSMYATVNGLKDDSLMRMLPRYSLLHLNVYVLYPSRQYLDAKIHTWIELLYEHMPVILAADERSLTGSGGLANQAGMVGGALQAVSYPLQLPDQHPQATRQCFQVAYQQVTLANRPGLVKFNGRQFHRPAMAACNGLWDRADTDTAFGHPADRLEAGDLGARRQLLACLLHPFIQEGVQGGTPR